MSLIDGDKIRTFSRDDGLEVGDVKAITEISQRIWVGGEFGLAFFDGERFRLVNAAGGKHLTASPELWRHPMGQYGSTRAVESFISRQQRFGRLSKTRLIPSTIDSSIFWTDYWEILNKISHFRQLSKDLTDDSGFPRIKGLSGSIRHASQQILFRRRSRSIAQY